MKPANNVSSQLISAGKRLGELAQLQIKQHDIAEHTYKLTNEEIIKEGHSEEYQMAKFEEILRDSA